LRFGLTLEGLERDVVVQVDIQDVSEPRMVGVIATMPTRSIGCVSMTLARPGYRSEVSSHRVGSSGAGDDAL
jgi:hypothetical protein